MALRQLMISKSLKEKRAKLEEIRAKQAAFETREAELEQSIDEAETEEEKTAVEEAVTEFESDKAATEEELRKLEGEIESLEEELRGITEKIEKAEKKQPEAKIERKETIHMVKRWKNMSYEERSAFVQQDEVQAFLTEVRTAIKERRGISNVGYTVPQVILGILKENIEDYSKLYRRVDLRQVPGTGRMVIEGAIPEAVWTEACANLNELDLGFSKVEVDGYKVGGYFKICNASLEDSDVDLASELISVLGQAIGLALDKAILYGTGTKMPVGIVTALAAVSDTPNIVSHAATVTGIALMRALIDDISKAKGKYSRGIKTWVMNETTYNKLISNFLEVDSSGAYVAAINGQMPAIGGDIVVLSLVPDNTIIAGYFDLYLLAERAGTTIGTSDQAFWTADMTGFKGTARYDGKVLIDDAFVAIGINGVTPAANQVSFAPDQANF